MKRFFNADSAAASAAQAEAFSPCFSALVKVLDAVVVASFFVIVLAVRLCLVTVLGVLALALVLESRAAREQPKPDYVI